MILFYMEGKFLDLSDLVYNLNLNVVFLTVIHIYIVDIETLEVTLKVCFFIL